MPNKAQNIFVYGTLRPGLSERVEAKKFLGSAEHVGRATFGGRLYLIDWYPGVIESEGSDDAVVGDLFKTGDNADFFDALDAYEGCSPSYPHPHEYRRVVRRVNSDGKKIDAWIYLYNWSLAGKDQINSGDFATHLSARRS